MSDIWTEKRSVLGILYSQSISSFLLPSNQSTPGCCFGLQTGKKIGQNCWTAARYWQPNEKQKHIYGHSLVVKYKYIHMIYCLHLARRELKQHKVPPVIQSCSCLRILTEKSLNYVKIKTKICAVILIIRLQISQNKPTPTELVWL